MDFPGLEMPQPGIKPANSDWPSFRPKGLPKELEIIHKMVQGYVDLQIRGAAERLDDIRALLSDPALEVVATNKSAAVRITVPPVNRFGSVRAQRIKVVQALSAAEKLAAVSKELRNWS